MRTCLFWETVFISAKCPRVTTSLYVNVSDPITKVITSNWISQMIKTLISVHYGTWSLVTNCFENFFHLRLGTLVFFLPVDRFLFCFFKISIFPGFLSLFLSLSSSFSLTQFGLPGLYKPGNFSCPAWTLKSESICYEKQ